MMLQSYVKKTSGEQGRTTEIINRNPFVTVVVVVVTTCRIGRKERGARFGSWHRIARVKVTRTGVCETVFMPPSLAWPAVVITLTQNASFRER